MTAPRVELLEEPLMETGATLRQRGWPAAQIPPAPERARHFAEVVRFAVAHPATMHRLQAATAALAGLRTPETLLPQLLRGALVLADADLGDVQVLDPTSDGLRLVAHAGFDADFVDRFGLVGDPALPAGRAVEHGRPVLVPDVEADEPFARHRSAAATYGFRSMLSTPLCDYRGLVVGVVSVHWRQRRRPSPASLRRQELYADYAGQRLAELLAPTDHVCPADDTVGPVARAMLDALLDPPPWPGSSMGPARGTVDLPPARPGVFAGILPSDRATQLADLVVTGLFSAELELDAARSLSPDRQVAARIAAATEDLEGLVTQVRAMVLTTSDEGEGPGAG